jgi:integrase
MRRLMGVIKDRHGTYYAQQRVPEPLQAAVARVLGSKKPRQVFLKKSLGTKVLKDANMRAKPVLAGFDQIIKRASDLVAANNAPRPTKRSSLNHAEMARMTEAYYGDMLAFDEEARFGGRASTARFVDWTRRNEDPDFVLPYPLESVPEFGINPEQLASWQEQNADALAGARDLLARGDIKAWEDEVEILLWKFDIDLDKKSPSYRELGTNVLRAYVRALEAIDKRNAGEAIETPKFSFASSGSSASGTLREALEGWKKERTRPEGTLSEYARAVEMFIQLHGNLPIADIKKRHALEFREALQLVPRTRSGTLLKAGLPELSHWGHEHPNAPKVSAGTVNKQLGAVQAIAGWGYQHGLVLDETPWPDPFRDMRLEEEQSGRGSFETTELQSVFDAPIFTGSQIPVGGKGSAGFWLPILALFAGARQNEIAGLQVKNVRKVEAVPLIFIVADRALGKRLKAKTSERVVPVHPQLVRIGFLDHVAERERDGQDAWLFPLVAPSQRRAISAWSKWFGHYLRTHIGISNPDRVFHSFRHSFQDALRRATPDAELRDALPGRSSGEKSVSRGYGAKYMIDRWGLRTLKETIDGICYPGLDLSRIQPPSKTKRTRGKEQHRDDHQRVRNLGKVRE